MLIETTIERAGRSLSTLSARMSQEGATMALALSAFSVPWTGPEISELAMPEVAPASPERDPGTLIPLELRPLLRALHHPATAASGGCRSRTSPRQMDTGGWLGLVEPRPLDALALAFFTDALIPTPFMRLPGPAPAPTIDLTVHFRTALPRPGRDGAAPDPHELVLARTRYAADPRRLLRGGRHDLGRGRARSARPVPAAGDSRSDRLQAWPTTQQRRSVTCRQAFGGGFIKARAELGVSSFGMQVIAMPPNFSDYPEHDHGEDGAGRGLRGARRLRHDGNRRREHRDGFRDAHPRPRRDHEEGRVGTRRDSHAGTRRYSRPALRDPGR